MAPSSYCLPLASTLQLNCLKDLHHHAASTLLPFMPSQALGHTHIPTNTTQLLQRQHCTSQCQDSFSYSPFPDHAPLASAGLHFPVFPLLLGVPSISSQGPCPCPDLLVSGGEMLVVFICLICLLYFLLGKPSPHVQNVSDRDHES